MKALVTGGAGFIGSHLVRALADSGIRVHVLDNLTTGNVANVDPRAVMHMADIRSSETRTLLIRESPDIVFHLAAQADVQQSIHRPDEDADVNVMGTIHLLQACHEVGVSKLIFASTSGVYGELQKQCIQEDDPVEPISGYGLSKLTAESYIRLFHRLYGMNYTILRYGNVYGPGQAAKGEGGVVALFYGSTEKREPLAHSRRRNANPRFRVRQGCSQSESGGYTCSGSAYGTCEYGTNHVHQSAGLRFAEAARLVRSARVFSCAGGRHSP